MALTVNIQPFAYSSSEDNHYMQVTSTLTGNYGFKYKIDYLTPSNTVLHTQYLAPNSTLANGVRFNLHEIMRDYVEPSKYIPIIPSNFYNPTGQIYEYKVRITEEYLQQFNIIDHEWVAPYANEGKTIIVTSSAHNFSVGDLVDIEITNVTGGTTQSQNNIKNALSGVKTVTNIISSTRFAINVPFPDSSTATYGVVYYTDLRKTSGATTTTANINVLWAKNNYEELFNTNSQLYRNNYTTTLTNSLFLLTPLKRTIFPWQVSFNSICEDGSNIVRRVQFISKQKIAYYACNGTADYKLVNVNPQHCVLTYTTGSAGSNGFLESDDTFYTIQYLNASNTMIKQHVYYVNRECPLFEDQLIFIDNKGNLQSFAVSLQKTKTTTNDNDQHRLATKYWTPDYVVNTKNRKDISMNVNTDWLDYNDYEYSEQLFNSPYIWYKEGSNTPQPCIIEDNTMESLSEHNRMFRRTFKIKLM